MAEPSIGTTPEDGAPAGPVIRDRRRLDPKTGQVRTAVPDEASRSGTPAQQPGPQPAHQPEERPAEQPAPVEEASPAGANGAGEVETLRALADERLGDLQRLQAEYVNYRRRVERDRDLARAGAVAGVLEALLPVLDDVHLARQHGDLESGPFAAIAEKLEATLGRFGLVRFGEPGETFDPTVHEALMHTQAELAEGTTQPTVVQVLQPGYRMGDRVVRAARVAVADPD